MVKTLAEYKIASERVQFRATDLVDDYWRRAQIAIAEGRDADARKLVGFMVKADLLAEELCRDMLLQTLEVHPAVLKAA